MRKLAGLSLGAALSLSLAACGSPAEQEPAGDAGADAVEPAAQASTGASSVAMPTAFAQCRACHSVEPGQHGVGPSLFAVYGTKAGDLAGYTFSDSLKGSGLTWDDATLDKWLESPAKTVPGTKMVFVGMPDAAKRAEVITFMKTLK